MSRILCLLLCATCMARAGAVGFGAAAKGGEGGRVVTVRSAEELRAAASSSDEPLVIRIESELRIGTVPVRSNKTLEGGGRLIGTLMIGSGVRSVIVRDLTITNPSRKKDAEGYDGISIRGGRDVWVDGCTFFDCADGAVDITNGADRVTISRSKFHYSSEQKAHRFPILATGPPKKSSKGRLHLTLYRNWFAEGCGSRMPAAVKARVHQFNNFFDCPGNDYCSNARSRAEILSERNVFRGVNNPLYAEDGGKIRSRGDLFEGTSGRRAKGDDDVFEPDYPYETVKASAVPDLVRSTAGN